MILKKIIASIGIMLCTASLGYACNDRQMDRQKHRVLTKHQRFMDRHENNSPFKFTPHFKANTIQGQCFLTLLIMSSVIGTVEALDKPSSTQQGRSFQSSSHHDCLATSNSRQCAGSIVTTSILDSSVRNVQELKAATISGLNEVFRPGPGKQTTCFGISDDRFLTFRGTRKQADDFVEKLGNFPKLRENLIPPSTEAAKTQAHQSPEFTAWTEVQKSLGVLPENLKNMAISECSNCLDCAESLGIDYDNIKDKTFCSLGKTNNFIAINYKESEIGVRSFNQKTADSFLETLKEESLFFKFLTEKNKDIITYTDGYVFINYGIFNEYLSLLNPEIMDDGQGIFTVTMPLETVLKRLMAVVSGEISLEQTSTSGEYHVRTVTLGDRPTLDKKQSILPIIEIILDRSGSMQGEPINIINRKLPVLLRDFKDQLGINNALKMRIYLLNHELSLYQEFVLSAVSDISKWEDIAAEGGTNLIPIGEHLEIKNGESSSYKVVIGFTDGEHIGRYGNLDAHYVKLKELQDSGSFARPFLCKVGVGSDDYFRNVAGIFAGSYSKEDNIEQCIRRISQAIPSLLVSKEPLILTINGNNKVIWQENDQLSIHTTTETVHTGDVITYGKLKATVPLVETKEEKKARLLAELKALGE